MTFARFVKMVMLLNEVKLYDLKKTEGLICDVIDGKLLPVGIARDHLLFALDMSENVYLFLCEGRRDLVLNGVEMNIIGRLQAADMLLGR